MAPKVSLINVVTNSKCFLPVEMESQYMYDYLDHIDSQ